MSQITTQDFITKALQVHKEKYNYSNVVYKNAHSKIEIICPEHGSFFQIANDHIAGAGCSRCAGLKQMTTVDFINKANSVHNGKYDYSNVKYKNNYTKVEIICKRHGIFQQIPSAHLQGQGCISCAGKKKLTTEEFTIKSKAVHGNRYDYSKAQYQRNNEKIEIICHKHGSFFQTPYSHIKGAGCPKCAGSYKLTTKDFITKANIVHENRYNYSKAVYKNAHSKIEIICHKHGSFFQNSYSHLSGSGCPKCGGSCKLTTEEFITKANIVHENRYDYSITEYTASLTKVKIICKEHGPFIQTPNCHLSGSGCPKCTWFVSKVENLWLDYVGVQHRQIVLKINNKRYKVDGFDPSTNTVYEFLGDYWHGNPEIYDPVELNETCNKTYGELYEKTFDRISLLREAGYDVVYVWENIFKRFLSICSKNFKLELFEDVL